VGVSVETFCFPLADQKIPSIKIADEEKTGPLRVRL
jgi:hypothetical protein